MVGQIRPVSMDTISEEVRTEKIVNVKQSFDVCPHCTQSTIGTLTDGISKNCTACGFIWHRCSKDVTGQRVGYVAKCPDDCYWGRYKAEFEKKSTTHCVIL